VTRRHTNLCLGIADDPHSLVSLCLEDCLRQFLHHFDVDCIRSRGAEIAGFREAINYGIETGAILDANPTGMYCQFKELNSGVCGGGALARGAVQGCRGRHPSGP
jgi:hypothetical protein